MSLNSSSESNRLNMLDLSDLMNTSTELYSLFLLSKSMLSASMETFTTQALLIYAKR